ncbi:hypothetical protein PMZ80_010423 [Knufia obscura]|uniref:Uncharacterized protein n=2 Tax=Knufia TaxID=430999 RepID=A0AAN8EXZ3_9EURO|nr:hypothetical protein PMZ80_010423 [Knufia obscura]KAK5948041.1 hypothetical protein OHC33_010969 [Knufia fluminis]
MQIGVNMLTDQAPNPKARSFLKRSTSQRQCPICNRLRCPLRTHQAFAKRLKERQQNASLHQIDDEKPDPFVRHPIPMTAELERFYAQGFLRWNSDFKGPERHLFPISRFRAVLHNAWDDEALHYGILSIVATQTSMLRDGKVDQTALELQVKIINLQRRALAHGEMSDARVMTALCIMSNAWASNESEDLSVHMELITTWLHRRKGLQYLGMEGILADNLMYGDHTRAITYNQKPHYQIKLPAISSESAPQPGNAYLQLRLRGLVSEEVATAATNYVVLVKIFDKAAKGRCTPSQSTYFAYLANVVEYQLACANSVLHGTNTLDECIVLACLVSNHSLLRNYGQLAPSIPEIERRLWRCLDHLRGEQYFQIHRLLDVEFYLVCMGTVTSVRRASPFEERMVNIMGQMRRNSSLVPAFYDLCDILEKYGWSESVCLTLYARIWNKSSDMQLVEAGQHE